MLDIYFVAVTNMPVFRSLFLPNGNTSELGNYGDPAKFHSWYIGQAPPEECVAW
jgi:hypothetical protein